MSLEMLWVNNCVCSCRCQNSVLTRAPGCQNVEKRRRFYCGYPSYCQGIQGLGISVPPYTPHHSLVYAGDYQAPGPDTPT
jgi:hypothetical protein